MREIRFCVSACVVLLLLVCFGGRSLAQTVTGSINGIVTDQTGAVLPGATVTLTNEQTKESRDVTTGKSGDFVYTEILPGTYDVAVSASGFKHYSQTGISLSTNEKLDLHRLTMQVGGVNESISVETQAARVETENADRTGLVTSTQIDTMPNSGQNYLATLRAIPGVTEGSGGGTPTIAGGRIGQAVVQLDGVSFQDNGVQRTGGNYTPNIEAIGEVKVMLSNYSAEYGTRSGGQINVSAKSGTNQFHGSVYDFVKNEAFNARGYFDKTRVRSRFNNPGFTLGGPLYVPSVFNTHKDKVFFFYAQEWLPSSGTSNPTYIWVPTAAERNGDFSAIQNAGGLFPGSSGATQTISNLRCPNGQVIPTTNYSNVFSYCSGFGYGVSTPTQYYFNSLFPLPNNCSTGVVGNCTSSGANDSYLTSSKTSHDQELARIDFAPRAGTTAYVRGIRDLQVVNTKSDQNQLFCNPISTCAGTKAGQFPFLPGKTVTASYGVVGTWIQTLNPHLVNDFTVGFNLNIQNFSPGAAAIAGASLSTIGLTGANAFPTPSSLASVNNLNLAPYTSFSGDTAGVTLATPNGFNGNDQRYPFQGRQEAVNYVDNLSYVHGSHNFKFGVYIERGTRFASRESFFNGTYSFNNDTTNPLNTNLGVLNALFGVVDLYQQSASRLYSHGVYHDFDWYLQDSWKVTKRLSVNYGIRFQYITPTYSQGDQQNNFVPSAYNGSNLQQLVNLQGVNPYTGQTVGKGLAGDYARDASGSYSHTIYPGMVASGVSKSAIRQPPIGLGPRIGFAYDVFGDGKTAVRGGWGMFNDRPIGDDIFNQLLTQAPTFLTYASADTTFSAMQSAFAGGTSTLYLPPTNVQGYQTHWQLPGSYSWSLGVQQDVGHGFLVDVAYQANVGRHLTMTQNINAVPYGSLTPGHPNFNAALTAAAANVNYASQYRPFPEIGTITYFTFDGNSNYNSLQTQVTRRFSRSLTASGAWTYSKVLDYGTGGFGGNTWLPYIPRDREYGPASTDRRHVFTANWTYSAPDVGRRVWDNIISREIMDGWQLSGLMTMESGTPLTVSYTVSGVGNPTGALPGDGLGTAVNVTGPTDGDVHRSGRTVSHLNINNIAPPDTSASNPTPGLGNGSVKKIFTGPGLNNWDVSVFKNFYIGENKSRSLELRMETYNVFNHTQFSSVSTAAQFKAGALSNANTLGLYTAANAPRTMQLVGRFRF